MNHPVDLTALLLQASPIFSPLGGETCRALAEKAEHVRKRPDEYLWQWGDRGNRMALILEGRVEVSRTFGRRHLYLTTHTVGDVVGFPALVGEAYSADVSAVSPTRVALIACQEICELTRTIPDVGWNVVAELSFRKAAMEDRVMDARANLPFRLRRLLEEIAGPDGVARVTHAWLAYVLDAERANVTRALGRLQRNGDLLLARGEITLTNRAAKARVAC